MKYMLRGIVLVVALVVMGAMVLPSDAAAYQSKKHHQTYKKKAAKKKQAGNSSAAEKVRMAQAHLINLEFLVGKADGVLGPKTKAALKKFQKANGLVANGQLNAETEKALAEADRAFAIAATTGGLGKARTQAPVKFYSQHPDYYGYVNQNYADAFQIGVPAVPSRFARIDVREAEIVSGLTTGQRRYDVMVNGVPLFTADDQPAVIGISRTYSMLSEDAVIFTAFRPNNLVCSYRHYLFVLNAQGNRLLDIDNCTYEHTANLVNNMLVISFPENPAERTAPSVWRYDSGSLNKL